MELEPKTRKEMFLAKAAGQSVETPKPITREEMFLEAIAKGGSGGTGGIPFTKEDKEKLDSLTNPILLKDRVDSYDDLQNVENPKIGWLYFVGAEGAGNFAEYIYTDKKRWEYIGENSVDLSNYVQKTNYATATTFGVLRTGTILSTGLRMSEGTIYLGDVEESEIISENKNIRKALVPKSIPIFMQNYNITKDTILDILNRLTALESKMNGESE